MRLIMMSLLTMIWSVDCQTPQTEEKVPLTQRDTVHFAKGRAVTLLIGIRKPDVLPQWNEYINQVFPVAMKYGYDPGFAFNVMTPTRGNYHPGFVAMASFPNLNQREQFRADPALPDNLEEKRRAIWSRFDQLFFDQITQPLTFSVREDRVYVFTAYWLDDQQQFDRYHRVFKDDMSDFSGKVLAELRGGVSPKNHLYDPDILMISEWSDLSSLKKHLKHMEEKGLNDGTRNINEFATTYVFGFNE